MNEHIRLTIEDLQRRRQQCDEAIRLLLELEGNVFPPMAQMPSEMVKPGRRQGKPAAKIQTAGSIKARSGRKNPFSKYHGVYDGKVTADGRQRYLASITKEGKTKKFGTFYVEELAAAAVQEAKGNKAEAKRLREMAKQKAADQAEQQENNPGRSATRKEDKAAEPELVWKCTHCKLTFKGEKKPVACPGCSGTNFKPVADEP